MPYIKVNINKINGFGSSVAATRSRVNSIKSDFYSIGNALDWDVKACESINSQINQINNELSNEMLSLKRMESFFSTAAKKYSEADKERNSKNKFKFKATIPHQQMVGPGGQRPQYINNLLKDRDIKLNTGIGISDSDRSDIKSKLGKLLLNMAKKVGYIGSAISITDGFKNGVSKIIEGNVSGAVKDLFNVGKGASKTVSAIRKKIKNLKTAAPIISKETRNKNIVRAVFGFDNYFDPKTVGVASQAKSTSTRIYNNFQKSWNKEIGGITKANVIISGIFNAFSNYSEMKSGEIGVGRMVAETVGETAVDVTIDAALYAGAAAVLAGIAGTAAVPVVAVAAVVVAAKWSADTIVDSLTDKSSLTEWISDGLLDIGGRIGTGISNTVKEIKDGTLVSKIRNTCTNTLDSIKQKASGFIGNVQSTVSGIFSKLRHVF